MKIYPSLTKKCQMFEFGNQKINNIETKEVTRIAEYSIRAAFFLIVLYLILILQPLCSWLPNDRDIRLLIKFLTVYTCITFHFFALALGEKGVFYSYKKISMLHFCNWKKNAFWNWIFVLGKKLSLYDQ
jgi:hypothetical protein